MKVAQLLDLLNNLSSDYKLSCWEEAESLALLLLEARLSQCSG